MLKDLKKVKRSTRKKPGMQDFFILILVYSYYNRSNINNEFSLPQSVLAEYYKCSILTIKRWFSKLRDIGVLSYAERENSGEVIYYKDPTTNKRIKYVIPKYKHIKCGNTDEIKFLNIYKLDQNKLNQYLIDTVDIDILSDINSYKYKFDDFILFVNIKNQKQIEQIINNDIDLQTVSKQTRRNINKYKKIQNSIEVSLPYLQMKDELDKEYPDFICKYLKDGCLRLTHEICNTVNPEHTTKINNNNYWRNQNTRNNLLETLLNQSIENIIEYDINGSIYRLTYNLNHDMYLDQNIDIYKLIWHNCGFNIELNDDNLRDQFKKILMPIYMKESSVKFNISRWNYINTYIYPSKKQFNHLSKDDKNFYDTYKQFVDVLHISLDDFIQKVIQSMKYTLNTNSFIGSSIFIYESNLHIAIRYKLMLKHIKAVNIYDGFYLDKNSIIRDNFYSVYNECLTELKQLMSEQKAI